jgi:hypothetical protein
MEEELRLLAGQEAAEISVEARTTSLVTAIQSDYAIIPERDQLVPRRIFCTAVDCYWLPASITTNFRS